MATPPPLPPEAVRAARAAQLWTCPLCAGQVNALPNPATHHPRRFQGPGAQEGANCPHCLKGKLVHTPAIPLLLVASIPSETPGTSAPAPAGTPSAP